LNERRQVIYAGHKLRKARLEALIGTQKELAEKTGIPANIISDLERGKRQMSPNWAKRIAEAVGGSWTDFFDLTQ
jgi:Plasmid maintenance system antidote protein